MTSPAVTVLTLTLDELRALVREEVRAAVAPPVDAWVPVARCGLPATTRRRLTREGKLPVSKVGRSLMVRSSDVASFVESQVLRHADHPSDEFTRALQGRR